MWYFVTFLLGLVLGLYIGSTKLRDKVNSTFRKVRDKNRERRAKRRESG